MRRVFKGRAVLTAPGIEFPGTSARHSCVVRRLCVSGFPQGTYWSREVPSSRPPHRRIVRALVQVVNETINILTRKYGFALAETHDVASSLLDLCEVVPVGADTVREALRLAARYRLSHWDSLIVAAALLADCETLYSEDLQHGQVADGRLTIVNPFRA